MKNLLKISVVIIGLILSSTVIAESNSSHDLQKAFFKEYSFLIKEKKAMQKRVTQLKRQMSREKNSLTAQLNSLKMKNDSLLLKIERINENMTTLERETIVKETNLSVFDATLEQATASLNNKGDIALKTITETITKAINVLEVNSRLHNEPGKFYLQNGTEVMGQIIHFGGIARFGINDQYAGALAPAGGGEFKLWDAKIERSIIEELLSRKAPNNTEIFLFESAMKEVKSIEKKDALSVINSGGIIAWIIVSLGAVALFFALLRTIFLMVLGSGSKKQFAEVVALVTEGNLEKAKEIVRKTKGSTKRVIRATLHNIHRDKDHVEDTISEAILHEHSYLDRFHSIIMVIAAISPLLGLLGTVTGMIETFDIITEFGTGDPKLLSGGISIALVTTELGLIVAIPVLVLGTMLSSWGNKIKDDIERSALHLVNQYQNNIHSQTL